jgi:MFS family permease
MPRERTVIALLLARLVSLTGSSMTLVALPWFVLVTTGSPGRMGLVLAVQLLPVALLGIPSGSVLSVLGARRTMVLADLLRAPLVAAIPTLHWLGDLSFPLLLVLAFATGVFRAPYGAAMHVLMPEIAGEDEALVARANALFQTVTQGTAIFGPVVAGVLIGIVGAPAVILVDAGSFLASALLVVAFVRAGDRAVEEGTSRGVLAGIRFLAGDSLLLPLVGAAIALSLAHEALVGMLPVLAFDRFGHASAAGTIFAADGIGSVIGSVVVMRLTRRLASRHAIRVSVVVMAVALWPLTVPLPLAAVAATMFVFGFGSMIFVPPLVSMLTLRAPSVLRPKVLTAYVTASTLAAPAGLAAAGPAVQAFGLTPVFVGIAGAFTVGAVGLWIVIATRGRADAIGTPAPSAVSAGS